MTDVEKIKPFKKPIYVARPFLPNLVTVRKEAKHLN